MPCIGWVSILVARHLGMWCEFLAATVGTSMAAATQHFEVHRLEQQSRRAITWLLMMHLALAAAGHRRAAALAPPLRNVQRFPPCLEPSCALQETHTPIIAPAPR